MICSINGTRVAIKADLATSEHFLNSPQAPSALITILVAATTSRVREKWFGSIGRFDPCNRHMIGWLFKGKVLRAANMEIDYTRRDNHLLSGGIVS